MHRKNRLAADKCSRKKFSLKQLFWSSRVRLRNECSLTSCSKPLEPSVWKLARPLQWTISVFPEDVDRWISTHEYEYSRAVRNKDNLVPLSGVLCKSAGRLCIWFERGASVDLRAMGWRGISKVPAGPHKQAVTSDLFSVDLKLSKSCLFLTFLRVVKETS